MAETRSADVPALDIKGLNVFYGASHALQGVDLRVGSGVLSVVGRNGMGKTTLCKAIMGLVPVASGTISFRGQLLNGKSPSEIARLGIGYVPQGRRLWRSLSVDEHLRLVATPGGDWSVDRIYDTFPRLAERKGNGGAQLSGGEQQMLAISRALLLNPKLLVMDEPTEGLAPVIVSHVEGMLLQLVAQGDVDVLVIEQNIAVATGVAQTVAVMVNGQVNRTVRSSDLANDRDLQQRLLGVGQHAHDEEPEVTAEPEGTLQPYQPATHVLPKATRWSDASGALASVYSREPRNEPRSVGIVVIGSHDRYRAEMAAISSQLKNAGKVVTTVDVCLRQGLKSSADVSAQSLSAWHPRGAAGIFDGRAIDPRSGLAEALHRYLVTQTGVEGVVALFDLGEALAMVQAIAKAVVSRPVLVVGEASAGDLGVSADNLIVFRAHGQAARGNAASAASLAMTGLLADGTAAQSAGLVLVSGPTGEALSSAVERHLGSKHNCMRFAPNPGGTAAALLALQAGAIATLDLDQSDLAESLGGKLYATVPNRPAVLSGAGRPYISVLSGGSLSFHFDAVTSSTRLRALEIERASAVGKAYAAALMAAAGEVCVIVPTEAAGTPAAALNSAFLDAFSVGENRRVQKVPGGPLDPSVFQEIERIVARFGTPISPLRGQAGRYASNLGRLS